MNPFRTPFVVCAVALFTLATVSASGTNSVPILSQPLSPASVAAGSPAFTLIVKGVGFVSTSRINWNGVKRTTTFVSSTEVTAQIGASDIAAPGTAAITVQNTTPGGGISNVVYLPIGVSKTSLTGTTSTFPEAPGAGWPAVADLNGNGTQDVAVVNPNSKSVSVFLGNGDGTFHAHVEYTVGKTPMYVVAGDFNGDTKLDLATANQGSNNVSVLLGNGDGTFQAAVNSAAGTGPVALAAADLNRDGKLDLIAANPTSNQISILLGNGNGTFATATTAATGADPVFIGIADIDMDGKLDAVVADANCSTPPCGIGSISLLRGNGDGTFSAKKDFTSEAGTVALAIADFNRDGAPDVVAVNREVNDVDGTLTFFRNTFHGNFAAPVSYPTGQASTVVTVADFNNDGLLDVGVLNSAGSDVTLLFGNNDGSFGNNGITATGFTLFGGPVGLAIGDFNNDGQLDFVSSDSQDSELDLILQQQAGPGVTLTPTFLTFGVEPVNQVTPNQVVTMTNSGGSTLTISSITVPTGYKSSNGCGSSLAAGASCAIQVAFAPTAFKSYGGNLTITDNAATSPQTVSLSGTGTLITQSAASLDFGNVTAGTTSSLPLTLTSLSTNTVNFTKVSITGTGAAQFTQTNNCMPSIPAKGSCTVTVTFAPTFTGARDATLHISDSGGPQINVPLSGTGQ